MRLYDGVQLAFGPTVENGFYYDFQTERPLSEEDFPAIEAEMAKIVKDDEPFERLEMDRSEAVEFCRDLGQTLKVEHIETGLADHGRCRSIGRASSSTSAAARTFPPPARSGRSNCSRSPAPIGKAMPTASSCSGSTAPLCSSKEELEDYLKKIEEAKRRDHRVLGKQLELFTINPMVGSGLILWLPKGAIVRRQLENFIKDELLEMRL